MVSFSKEVKEELLSGTDNSIKTILSSVILSIGSIQLSTNSVFLEIKSSNITLIRKVLILLKKHDSKIDQKVIVRENKKFKKSNKVYIINIEIKAKDLLLDLGLIESDNINIFTHLKIPPYLNENEEYTREFLKYLFICCGSINNPKLRKQYHLEIIINNVDLLIRVQKIVKKYDIHFKITKRKNISALYLNKGEEIADFLRLIGCIKTMFDFEDQRLMRDIRATENRLINAEIANETKKNIASLKQLEAIKKIKKQNQYNNLKDKTKLVAKTREENKDASLNELFTILDGRISKSNIRYHLNLLIKEAEEL